MMIEVNFISVLLAAIASMAIGFLWYSPSFFGKPWMRLMGYDAKELKKEQQKMGVWYMMSFGLALLTAFVLTHLVAQAEFFYQMPRLTTALLTAFWGWLGLVMPVQMTDMIFGKKKSWMLFGINTGYQFASLMAMGLVIALLG